MFPAIISGKSTQYFLQMFDAFVCAFSITIVPLSLDHFRMSWAIQVWISIGLNHVEIGISQHRANFESHIHVIKPLKKTAKPLAKHPIRDAIQ